MTGQLKVEKADVGYSPLRNDFSTALIVLMAMVGLVLLIACANVANLLIARGFMRQREIAVRLSLGATRGQLVRQLLTESVLLSLIGGALGIALSVALTRGLIAFIPQQQPLLIQPTPDLRILSFTFVLTLVTGIVFGLLPALSASNPDQWATLKDTVGGIAGTGGSLFLRKGLVAAQVALSFLLLFGAGLFVRSLQNLQTTDTGVEMDQPRHLPAVAGAERLRRSADRESLQRAARAAAQHAGHQVGRHRRRVDPGRRRVGQHHVGRRPPGQRRRGHAGVHERAVAGLLRDDGHQAARRPRLQRLGHQRKRQDRDRQSQVREAFLRRQERDRQAPRPRARAPRRKLDVEIIGVVEDSLYEGPREGVRRQVFWPGCGGSSTFYVRTTEASAAAFNMIRNEVKRLDAGMPVYDVKTVQGQLDETLLTDRLIALLSAGFGMLATVLASVGLYGVMAFIVARRRKEIGLRLALGAEPSGVLWIVMREVLILLVIGLADRRARRDRPGPLRVVAALRHPAERSVDGDRHRVAVDGGVGGRGSDSRDEGEPDRSDPGPEI